MPDHRKKRASRKKMSETTFESVFSLGHVRFACRVLIWVHGSYRSIFGKGGKSERGRHTDRPISSLTLVLNERTQRRGTRSIHQSRLSAKTQFSTKVNFQTSSQNSFLASFNHSNKTKVEIKLMTKKGGQPTWNDESFSRHFSTNGKIRSRTNASTTTKHATKQTYQLKPVIRSVRKFFVDF